MPLTILEFVQAGEKKQRTSDFGLLTTWPISAQITRTPSNPSVKRIRAAFSMLQYKLKVMRLPILSWARLIGLVLDTGFVVTSGLGRVLDKSACRFLYF